MSVQPGTEDRPSIDFVHQNDVPFGDLMDALVADDAAEADPGAPATPGGPGGGDPAPAGGPAPSGAPGGSDASGDSPASAGPAAAGTDAGAAGGSGDGSQPAGEPAAGGTAEPAAAGQPAAPASGDGIDPAVVLPQLGELSTKFEENVTKAYQQQAFDQAREDYGRYFEALEKHPRLLVGTEVPAIGKEGMETLKTTADAKEWQEAVRSLLVQEIRSTAETKIEESRGFLETVHASIDLFKNNPDLIPGTRNFDRELADRFAAMAKPYEVRADGKLQGYSIPVQPIIEGLRSQLQAGRASAPPSVPAPPAPPAKPDPPQVGIQSKAGNSSEREDFSTLFGTIGLPNLQI